VKGCRVDQLLLRSNKSRKPGKTRQSLARDDSPGSNDEIARQPVVQVHLHPGIPDRRIERQTEVLQYVGSSGKRKRYTYAPVDDSALYTRHHSRISVAWKPRSPSDTQQRRG